jgi:predicted permease
MIRNYLKTAWRSLLRNKSYTAINIAGLSVGIAACLLIFLIVRFETSFDNFHTKKARIYRVVSVTKGPNGTDYDSGVPFPTVKALRLDYPEFKEATAIMKNDDSHFTIGNSNSGTAKKFKEDDTYLVEPQFFDIFDFSWLEGNKNALSEPNTVVLTQSEAERFFGNWKDAIGRVIKLEGKVNLKVTGILKNVPPNTDFPLKLLISYSSMGVKQNDLWGNNQNDWISVFGSHYGFLLLPENMTVNQANADLADLVKKHKPAEYVKTGLQLSPLADMHYNTEVDIFNHNAFSHQKIDVISLIGLFLLIIACVNFINLATAQAVNRSKEVGIRKVLGSNRNQLVIQFISETFIITLFAIILAAAIASASLPFFEQLLEIKLDPMFMLQPSVLLFLLGLLAGVTLLAGFYPAIVLSGFNPITALKNKINAGKASGVNFRRALVVLQFCIAQVLVIGMLVIISQMNYFKNQPLGFVKDAVLNVDFPGDSISLKKADALRNELLQQPNISAVSYSFASPSDNNGWHSDFYWNNSNKKTDFSAQILWADREYFDLYKLKFIAGHPYPQSDTIRGYVINQTMLKKLGLRNPEEAIGKHIRLWDSYKTYAEVVGVVKDFNTVSLRHAIPPVLMASSNQSYQIINIKLKTANMSSTLATIERLWNATFPTYMYGCQFLDKKIEGFYKVEDQLSVLYKIFAGIAIFISCLGLYGLISFMAVQRVKEVGIRKTLGASVGNIVYLFSKEFTLLIIVAFVISAPVGWYFMHQWLQGFAYKTPLGLGIFMLAVAVSVVIAWLTVGYKAVSAALANPVKSLRSE